MGSGPGFRIRLAPAAGQANSDWPVVLGEDKPGELLYLDTKKLGRIKAALPGLVAGEREGVNTLFAMFDG
jgi:hypothetical protein